MPSRPKRSAQPRLPRAPASDDLERLQKILAAAGLGSRRHCEELILEGRVEVDRKVVTELGTKADRAQQEIRVDGVPLARPRRVYFLVNKPPGILSTNADPSGRPRVVDMVAYSGRLFTVGRLDMSSEGLILVTNDGELANRLTHPRYGVEKTYQVEVAGILDRRELDVLRRGVRLAEGVAHVVSAKVVRQYKHSTLLEIVLNEGRNREIRRILARLGHKVERLKRVALGPLRLAELPSGQVRPLERDEVRRLKQAALVVDTKPPKRSAKRPAAPPAAKPVVQARAIIGGDQTKAAGDRSAVTRPRKAGGSRSAKGRRQPARQATGQRARQTTR
jgi:23S rRNA pseudouridine2605 synthase